MRHIITKHQYKTHKLLLIMQQNTIKIKVKIQKVQNSNLYLKLSKT